MKNNYIAVLFNKGLRKELNCVLQELRQMGSSRAWLSIAMAIEFGYVEVTADPNGTIYLCCLRDPY